MTPLLSNMLFTCCWYRFFIISTSLNIFLASMFWWLVSVCNMVFFICFRSWILTIFVLSLNTSLYSSSFTSLFRPFNQVFIAFFFLSYYSGTDINNSFSFPHFRFLSRTFFSDDGFLFDGFPCFIFVVLLFDFCRFLSFFFFLLCIFILCLLFLVLLCLLLCLL